MHPAPMPGSTRAQRLIDPCGRFLPALVYHDLRDRLRGDGQRAKARWGALERPDAPGKLVWVVAGSSRSSVRLAVEIARAIMARRLDLSITLTFETAHADLLHALGSSRRLAWGYAPADYAVCMQAVWRRLLPFGIVLAGVAPRPNLTRLSEACRHSMLVAPPAFAPGRYERIYPRHGSVFDGKHSAAPADFDVLLLPSCAPEHARASDLTAGRGAFLLHGADPQKAKRIFALFRGHLPDCLLLLSGSASRALAPYSSDTVKLSTWTGLPIAPEKLVLLDDSALLPAIMPGIWGAHFDEPDTDALWQALAAGAWVTATPASSIQAPGAQAAIGAIDEDNALIAAWSALDNDRLTRDGAAETSRRAFAAEHKLAHATMADMLDRVCAWH